jgi:hypothetical protein
MKGTMGRRIAGLWVLLAAVLGLRVPMALGAPTELTACGTIGTAGSYVLANNLLSTSGDCVVIIADFVSLDLAGFVISQQVRREGVAGRGVVGGSGRRGIAVSNGTITGFLTAVVLDGEAGVIENLRIVDNREGLSSIRRAASRRTSSLAAPPSGSSPRSITGSSITS